MSIVSVFRKPFKWLTSLILSANIKNNKVISESDKSKIYDLLSKDYYIILTRRKTVFSTFFINLADFIITGKWGFWSHTLMNLEDSVTEVKDFRLIEATSAGVHYSPFEMVFNVESVALLKPKKMTVDEWTNLFDVAKAQLGKPYDTLFDITNNETMSCVELVRHVLQKEPNYEKDFEAFESMIKKSEDLTPQMFFDCGDFEIVFSAHV